MVQAIVLDFNLVPSKYKAHFKARTIACFPRKLVQPCSYSLVVVVVVFYFNNLKHEYFYNDN